MDELRIHEIIGRMKTIREIVRVDGTKAHDYLSEYYELSCDLNILDPNNEELQIGIHNKPFGAGLAD
jgi:hypothetical protein